MYSYVFFAKIKNNIIYADIIPISDEDKPFKIEIDIKSRKIIKKILNQGIELSYIDIETSEEIVL